ncbi:uncharacterized protein LOC131881152 isoform X2 [Tigriopus californicus]|uniref:uncharacterized protein LOC131881152 isoform X2 n=1 Tax=Tigriopus californicus TaxID=6832 RepID=UPI0027DA31AD|nr:uncharacterized protein LOC131881152 isoform X2 [Tigriopus californicus]
MSRRTQAIGSIQVISNDNTKESFHNQDEDCSKALKEEELTSVNEGLRLMGSFCSMGPGSMPWSDGNGCNLVVVLGLAMLILSCQVASASPLNEDYGRSLSPSERGFMLGKRMKHPPGAIVDRVISLPDQLNNLDDLFANADLDLEAAEAMELMADLARADQVAREARQEYLQLVDDLRYQRNEYEQGGHPDVLRMLESLGGKKERLVRLTRGK